MAVFIGPNSALTTGASGALGGAGTVGDPLVVNVDGSTVAVNGSNELEAIGGTPPGGSDTQVQFNDADTFGGDAGLTYNKTTNALTVAGAVDVPVVTSATGKIDVMVSGLSSGPWLNVGDVNTVTGAGGISQVFTLGNGLVATKTPGTIGGVTEIGASLSLVLTDAGSQPDITLIGEHMTVSDENSPQAYGLGLGGGGSDIVVKGGQNWVAIAAGGGPIAVDQGDNWTAVGSDIAADYLSGGYAFGNALDIVNLDNEQANAFLLGRQSSITNSNNSYTFGGDLHVVDTVGDPLGGMVIGGASTIDGDETFGALFTFGYGHTLTALADQQMLIGFDGTTLPASEAVGIGVSATPEIVITAGYASVTAALKVAMQTPATAAAAGVKDTIAFDTNFIYIATATNTWKRVAIATW